MTCGDVGGDVHASDSVRCHAIYGNVTADDGVHVKYRETPPPADDLGVARTVDYSFGIGSDGIHVNGKRLTVDKGFPFNGGIHLNDD